VRVTKGLRFGNRAVVQYRNVKTGSATGIDAGSIASIRYRFTRCRQKPHTSQRSCCSTLLLSGEQSAIMKSRDAVMWRQLVIVFDCAHERARREEPTQICETIVL
jgi:hypothetical protein